MDGGANGKQEDTGKPKYLAAHKHAEQGSSRREAHLEAHHFRLQGLADHCNQKIEAHKADTQAS